MRKITLWCMLLFWSITFAQITYDSSDFATAGEEFTVTSASGFIGQNFAVTGAGHNWNYSGLTPDTQTTTGWQNPNNAGYKLAWCLSHFYLFNCNSQFNNNFNLSSQMSEGFELGENGVSNIVAHSNVSATLLENKMLGLTASVSGISLPMAIDYEDPDEVLHFPIVYEDSYETVGHFNMDLNDLGFPFQYSIHTERNVTVEGWGSLTTPYGTFPEVLKVKTVLVRTDAFTYNDISLAPETTTVIYQWFDKEHGMPVLQAEGVLMFNFFLPLSVTYLDGPQCLAPEAFFGYLPTADYNPEMQSANVAFINGSANYDQIEWNFGDGSTSNEATPSHSYDCPGTHEVTLTVTNTVCQPNSTVTFTLPVVVTDSQNALTNEVTVTDLSITANRDLVGTTYQWLDCDNGNAVIDGETSQTFSPTVSGNYACMMSTNGCESISECTAFSILGNDHFTSGNFGLYPNPTNGQLQLTDSSIAVEKVAVFNGLGMLVGNKLDLSGQSTGIYFVHITTDQGSFVKKIMKQ